MNAIDKISEAQKFETQEEWRMFLMFASVGAPHVLVEVGQVERGEVGTIDLLDSAGLFGSRSSIRRLMKQNAFNIFDENGKSISKIKKDRPVKFSEVSDCVTWGTKKDRFMVFVHEIKFDEKSWEWDTIRIMRSEFSNFGDFLDEVFKSREGKRVKIFHDKNNNVTHVDIV